MDCETFVILKILIYKQNRPQRGQMFLDTLMLEVYSTPAGVECNPVANFSKHIQILRI
jgi:hypothetical protein